MPRINLKSLFSPKSDAYKFINALIQEMNAPVFVEDQGQQILISNRADSFFVNEAIMNEDDIIGSVKGNKKATLVASFINAWIQKELEKKRLANEVLLLYQ